MAQWIVGYAFVIKYCFKEQTMEALVYVNHESIFFELICLYNHGNNHDEIIRNSADFYRGITRMLLIYKQLFLFFVIDNQWLWSNSENTNLGLFSRKKLFVTYDSLKNFYLDQNPWWDLSNKRSENKGAVFNTTFSQELKIRWKFPNKILHIYRPYFKAKKS